MSRLDDAIKDMDPVVKDGFLEWLSERPTAIQKLAHLFPPRMKIFISMIPHWVMGYGELQSATHAHLLVSSIDPAADYEAAKNSVINICPDSITVAGDPELN